MAIQPLPLPDSQNVTNATIDESANPLNFYIAAIREQFGSDDWEDALKSINDLNKRTQAGYDNQIIQYTANYRGALRDRNQSFITTQEFNMTLARSRAGLLQILDELPKKLELRARTGGLNTGAFSFKMTKANPLERVLPGSDNLYKISWVEQALKYAKSVCRVVTPDDKGSGFLCSNGYLFTNHHVIADAATAAQTKVEFNFRTDMNGKALDIKSYDMDASTFYASEDLDFAYVRIKDRADAPLDDWGAVEFDTEAAISKGDAMTIIQHAGGKELQIALDANKVLSVWEQYLFYDTPTLGGSSGSPVFNQAWKVVALHHAGFEDTVIDAQGNRRGANRGILFKDIFEHLTSLKKPLPI